MITIYDIAKRAGVSPGTVSKVLNGYPDVSEKTRKRIQAITTQLGYHPSAVARGLVTKRSMTIGVFYQDHEGSGFCHPFFQELLASFKDVIGSRGYDMLFFANHHNVVGLESFESRARNRHVDGLLLFDISRTDPALSTMAMSQIPCMSIDLDLIGPRAGYVCSDNVGGAVQAVEYLIQCGHREIAFVGDQFSTRPGHDRLIGYERTLQKHGLQYRPEWVLAGDFTEAGGYRAVKRLLTFENIPTAVFCAGDMMAIGAMRAIREAGLRVGQDISVVGFDDVAFARYVEPRLTTVRQNKREMGARAATALLGMIEQPGVAPPVITVETELVIRESVHTIAR
ncbi:MAG: LacI family transcriptional regulator [Alicyclobacillus sp.]|nr:LacI family transcriptional regulator [Alicyclobacillus sp.]